MTYDSEPALRVLHAVRLKGVAEVAAVAKATAITPDEVERTLGGLAESGQVRHRRGPPAGWALSRRGAGSHARLVAGELEASGARSGVEEAHRRFLELNPELLATCTAWQLRDVDGSLVPNDHSDASHDRAVIGRLVEVHRSITPVLQALCGHLSRFCPYGPRLSSALDHVVSGEGDWFTRPLLDSYHSVWFELHQDLLETLAIDRAAERVNA